jgi:hypothetical protein
MSSRHSASRTIAWSADNPVLVVDNIFDKQAPYPFPSLPPNDQFLNINANNGLSTYYEGILGAISSCRRVTNSTRSRRSRRN